jgi:hypothetical protein
MIVSIMQPCYLPWLGYFDRLARSDLHVVLDHVQMEHGGRTSFTNRNKIRVPQGWAWLTVPVRTAGGAPKSIERVEIDASHTWRRKHWTALTSAYGRARFFPAWRERFEALYARDYRRLVEVLDAGTDLLKEALGIATPCLRSSALGVASTKSALILDLCRAVGASRYLSGPFGRDYLDRAAFAAAGIEIAFHDYAHPVYPQAFAGFEPNMSAVDVLFNHGPQALPIITRAGATTTEPTEEDVA